MASRLDIVVFGATGFTGRRTLPEVHKFANANGRNFTWGVAGRSEKKLKNVLSETAKKIDLDDLSYIPIIIADSSNEESIKRMTAQTKVVINLCGPYLLYGEVVVKSCIESGTHYLDATGEPLFAEKMELKYHEAAENKGVYIISCCGVVSLPADLGLVFLENSFQGTLNAAEVYSSSYNDNSSVSGARYHTTTWDSCIGILQDFCECLAVRKKLFANPLPEFQPQLSQRLLPFRKDSQWLLPYFLLDQDVVIRSQRYFYKHERKRPVQAKFYISVNSFATVLRIAFIFFVLLVLSRFKFGIKWLYKYPKFFSRGFISHEEPSEEVLEHEHFEYRFEGVGWSEKLAKGEEQYKTKPNKAIVGRVSGTNPGYGFTCVAITLCALVILTEPENLPAKGGVYTTAAAFSKTSLIEQLQNNNVHFEIISKNDLNVNGFFKYLQSVN